MDVCSSILSLPKWFQVFFLIFVLSYTTECSRITRAVMMSVAPSVHMNCSDLTIMEKNQTAKVVLTATVSTCDVQRAGSYKCHLQVWRVMKGRKYANDLINEQGSFLKKSYVDVYGLGNIAYCESNVKDHDTRIFFLNRSNDRLFLSASLLRITLTNLQNTQAVIEGHEIEEIPKKPFDPCLTILCGYGAHCEVRDGAALCICPEQSCTSPDGGEDLLAPVCGSDGVTYANECRLKDFQCMDQQRIKIVSRSACELDCEGRDRGSEPCQVSTTAPVLDGSLCSNVTCSYSADCVVNVGPDGRRSPSCVCPTCDGASLGAVCGSDRTSYPSECELRRSACMQAVNIEVLRNSACDPCVVFNHTTGMFEQTCQGGCLLAESGQGLCCNNIDCDDAYSGSVCGSDGNNYESECALRRYACKTARDLSVIQQGSCPKQKMTTQVSGSLAIASNCPGDCSPGNSEFANFLQTLQGSVNELLADTDDERTLSDFQVSRTTRSTLMFRASASTASQPIGLEDEAEDRYEWAGRRLEEAISTALENEGLSTNTDLKDGLLVDDVCLDVQCEYGAVCVLGPDLVPSCSCEEVGNGERQPIDLRCLANGDGETFLNMNDVRSSMCASQTSYSLEDICGDTSSSDSCADIGGCEGSGEVCVKMNGESRCECMTCNQHDSPVCGDDRQTYRSRCDLFRHNCLTGGNTSVKHEGHCDNPCVDVKCRHGAQCVVEAEGTLCVCPDHCMEVYLPVCGTDCTTYSNECEMMVEACKNEVEITAAYRGACDAELECLSDNGSGWSDETGSGRDDACQCRFGAYCDGTDDDEDASCVCSFDCQAALREELCGANGVTYTNRCEHKRAECEQQASIPVQEGSCTAVCRNSRYGCCQDGITSAKGAGKAGCPETCACNPHGSYTGACEPNTGQCVCRPGVGGRKCDRCQPGFWNFRALAEQDGSGCMACRCHEFGSTRDDCDQMSGQCSCKDGVTGGKCSTCAKDGSWVDATVCSDSSGSSCMECSPGQECFDVEGVFVCRCPTFAECEDFEGPTVCGSDGLTYPDACQMRVMTCKQGVLVRVMEEGKCKDGSPPLDMRSTPSTTSTSAPTSSSTPRTTKQTTTPLLDNETEEGSAQRDCGLTDDEDCYGSGDGGLSDQNNAEEENREPETAMESSTSHRDDVITTTTNPITTTTTTTAAQYDQSFLAHGLFKEVDGITLEYDVELSDPTSILYGQYNRPITIKISELLNDPLLVDKVKAFRVLAIEDNSHWFWGSDGVKVQLLITHDPSSSPEEVVKILNQVSNSIPEFILNEPSGSS